MEKINLKFEKFTEAGSRFNYIISLNKAGGFSFSAGFCKKHNIRKFPFVVLWYDRKTMAVGFSFCKEQVKEAFKISYTQSETASLRPNSFIKAHGIKPEIYAQKYEPRKYRSEEGEEIYYILLEKKK